MNAEQLELYQRLEQYEIDDPQSDFPFSARLARENGWTQAYTHRVIREYKRFAFLSMVAGHVVTPSEAVDQAWHLHMIYTRSYWNDFCTNILTRPLHHDPTKGGESERQKFYDLYDRTMASYRRFFGEEPPADIWHDPRTRFEDDTHFARVNIRQNWVIPKPRLRDVVRTALMLIVLPLVITACAPAIGISNPFDLYGPDFLNLYIAVLVVAVVGAVFLRAGVLSPNPRRADSTLPNLNLYETAYLTGGAQLAAETAVVNLTDRGLLQVSDGTLRAAETLPNNAQPVERAVYHNVARNENGSTAYSAVREGRNAADGLRDRLLSLGLLPNPQEEQLRRYVPMLILLGVALFGVIKIFVGLSRERPVGYLTMLVLLTGAVAILGFGRRLSRSRYGETILYTLRARRPSDPTDTDNAMIWSVALTGVAALSSSAMFADLYRALRPPSTDGGGGGDAGGGGCGGGCGGCGGCGGD